jgi:hypothetical protein
MLAASPLLRFYGYVVRLTLLNYDSLDSVGSTCICNISVAMILIICQNCRMPQGQLVIQTKLYERTA